MHLLYCFPSKTPISLFGLNSIGKRGKEPVEQAHAFYNAITCPKEFYSLTVEDGADNHCA